MLPTPPIRVWSSSARLTSVCRRRAAEKASTSNARRAGRCRCREPAGIWLPALPRRRDRRTCAGRRSAARGRRREPEPGAQVSLVGGFGFDQQAAHAEVPTRARSEEVPSARPSAATGTCRAGARRPACGRSGRPRSARRPRGAATARGWSTSTGRPLCVRRPTARGRAGRPRPRAAPALANCIGELRHRWTGQVGGQARQAASATSCSAAFFVMPTPAVDDPGQEHLGGEGLGVVTGPVIGDDVSGSAEAEAEPSSWRLVFLQSRAAPRVAASTSSGSNSRWTIRRRVQPAARKWTAPDQRLERVGEDRVLLRPPVVSSPQARAAGGGRCRGRRAALPTPPTRVMLTTEARSLAQLPLGEGRLAAVELVGDDEAEHRVAEELQALVGQTRRSSHAEGPVRQRHSPSRPSGSSTPRGRRAANERPACASPPRRTHTARGPDVRWTG